MRAAAAVVAIVLAAGCAQLGTQTPQDQLFELAGRIAARQGDEAFSGNLRWRHAGSLDELLLTSPLGQGVARIVRKDGNVTLTTAEPREYRAPDAESLTEQTLGFRLPLAGLADWVRGRPSQDAPFDAERLADGRLRVLEQNGWRIEYLEYTGGLPSRLRLSYPGIDLRLAISSWQ
ncbi:MAG TPA: lipoprotein insertase outer membrane protein LolB [Burkholderiales bacterium]|nr:lipoprotein insertase outer membrane protein LolB [Burkholderiales bacterium]